MSAALPLLSPLVTRILELKGFPSELKTRDIQAIFAQWEEERGGFKIKWVDDTTALVIFADPISAKRAYLQVLMSPPPMLMNSSGMMAKVRPYDGEDASSIISSMQNRPRSRSNAGGQALPAYGGGNGEEAAAVGAGAAGSAAATNGAAPPTPTRTLAGTSPRSAARPLGSGHRRNPSGSNPSTLPPKPLAAALYDAANGGPSPAHHLANAMAADATAAAAATAAVAAASSASTMERSGSRKGSLVANSSPLAHHRLDPLPEITRAAATTPTTTGSA